MTDDVSSPAPDEASPPPTPPPGGPLPLRSSLLEEGVLAGLLGAAVVAVWFLVLDGARGQLFHTPTLLGSVLFLGTEPAEVTGTNGMIIFAYSGLHVVAFLMAGAALAWMVSQFERNPQFGFFLLLLFLLFESLLFSFEAAIFPRLVGELGTVAVAAANLFSAITMFAFLLGRHPGAIDRLRHALDEEDD